MTELTSLQQKMGKIDFKDTKSLMTTILLMSASNEGGSI